MKVIVFVQGGAVTHVMSSAPITLFVLDADAEGDAQVFYSGTAWTIGAPSIETNPRTTAQLVELAYAATEPHQEV